MSMRRFTAAELDIGHVPVTQGLAPAPSLSEALLRECRDMGPTLESRVSGPLGRHGVLVWAGCGRPDFYVMLCYVHTLTLAVVIIFIVVPSSRHVHTSRGWRACNPDLDLDIRISVL